MMGILVGRQEKNGVGVPENSGDLAANPQHARTLAAQLVRHLGVNEARRTCQDHRWDNVLVAVRLYETESESE